MVKKEVGILFHFKSARTTEPDNLRISNLFLHVDLENDPLVWIGSADQGESEAFLESNYASAGIHETKKRLIGTIGLHDPSPNVVDFLRTILFSSESTGLRKEAAFWLS